MVAALNRIPNDTSRKIILAGFEPQRGIRTDPDFKLYGDLNVTEDQPLVDVPEYDGSYDAYVDPVFGPMTFGGTYAQPLSYEDGPPLMEIGVKGGVTPVSDGETTPGYGWSYSPPRFRDDLNTLTVQHGFPGMPKEAEMVLANDFTISADIDDTQAVWQYSSNLWTRYNALLPVTPLSATGGTTTTAIVSSATWVTNEWAGAFVTFQSGPNDGEAIEVLSNDGTTLTFVSPLPAAVANGHLFDISGVFQAGVSDRTRDRIAGPGTKLYINDDYGDIGTTEVPAGFISFSVTLNNMLGAKRFMNDVDRMSRKLGRGKRIITGQVRLEFDTRKEYDRWREKRQLSMRIEQIGPVIDDTASPDPTTKIARIDIARAFWGGATEDARGTNLTKTFPFWAFLDAATGARALWYFKNTQSAQF